MSNKYYKTLVETDVSKRLMSLIILIALTTWVHHIYGGIVYDTIYRIVVPTLTIPFFLVATFYIQYLIIKKSNKMGKNMFALAVSFFWILPIGLIEGGYNHILKNVL